MHCCTNFLLALTNNLIRDPAVVPRNNVPEEKLAQSNGQTKKWYDAAHQKPMLCSRLSPRCALLLKVIVEQLARFLRHVVPHRDPPKKTR